jgi:hypothetical protein
MLVPFAPAAAAAFSVTLFSQKALQEELVSKLLKTLSQISKAELTIHWANSLELYIQQFKSLCLVWQPRESKTKSVKN